MHPLACYVASCSSLSTWVPNFTSFSHWPACRLTSHLLMTRMMPWVKLKHETETEKFQLFSRRKPLIVKSGQQKYHNEVLLSKSDFSLQNEDIQRNLHHLFAHAMDWAQPIPAFQRLLLINPHWNGGEINQVFDKIKNQFHQGQEWLAASPTYSRLSTTRS